jgi:hypothetical protein
MIAFFVFGTTCAFADDVPQKEGQDKKPQKNAAKKLDLPELFFFTVTPTTMTYEGSQITVSVKVIDYDGVKTVIAILIKPNGQ